MPHTHLQDGKHLDARRRVGFPYPARGRGAGLIGRLKAVALIASLLPAAGCSMRSELGFMTLMNEVPTSQAMIVPAPGGPSVVAVLQRSYQNGVSQEIALSTAAATAGQNTFYVSFAKQPETTSEINDSLTIPPLGPETVQREMEERLPGTDMRTSLVYVQNKYGPFGFATGRSAFGDTCIYAWQQIEPNEAALFTPGGTISIRLRLCDADATEAQLLRTMYDFTISAYFISGSWNPYGTPPPPPAGLGQTDAPYFPFRGTAGTDERPLRSPAPETRTVVRRSPAATLIDKDTVPAPPDEPAAPLGGYPVVPPPPGN